MFDGDTVNEMPSRPKAVPVPDERLGPPLRLALRASRKLNAWGVFPPRPVPRDTDAQRVAG